MKRYITIAALIAAGAALANADDEQTISPLFDKGNWEHNAYNPDAFSPSISSQGKYLWKELDQQGYSSYDSFDKIVLDSADDYFSFSYSLRRGLYKASGEVLTLALVGSQNAIVTGYSGTQSVSYGVTDIIAESYTFDPCTWGGTVLSGSALCNLTTATTYKFEGTTSWDTTLSEFVLSLTLSSVAETITPVANVKVALGAYLDVEKLIISINGAKYNFSKSYPELSDLALTWGHVNIPVPEPSAFGLLAGLGALALAGTRRRRS